MGILWQKCTDRTGKEYMEITGFEGRIRCLSVPREIEEIPVRSVGKNAFSGREDLEAVILPETIDTLGRYAFYNCRNLRTLSLYDGVEDYYDGVIKQCESLSEITLFQERGSCSVMKELLADNDRMLHFVLEPMGLHLTFPAYVYQFVEDVEARVLHHKIEGSGYPYRECVTRRGVDLLNYDRLFSHVVTDDYHAAVEIALGRLMYPVELEQNAKEIYGQYLEQNADVVLGELVPAGRLEEIRFLCDTLRIPRQSLAPALELTVKEQKPQITAVLMEYQRKHFESEKKGNTLSLEDW